MNYYKDIDFSKYTSIKIGGVHKVLVIERIGDYSGYQIIGRANNLLISPKSKINFAILGDSFNYIKEQNNKLFVGSATSSGKLFSYCKKNNISDLEFLSNLPGNIGGITKMNAGLKSYEIFNHILQIKTKDGYLQKENLNYSYRTTSIENIIYEIVLEKKIGFDSLKVQECKQMRANQPKIASAGSCFKNPPNDFAGRLIEAVRLKGEKKGAMSFSKIHANFLVNEGGGTFEDAIFLIELAKKRVYEDFGIELFEEINIFK